MLNILKDEGLRRRFNELGMEVTPISRDALVARIRSEADRYRQIIERTGVKLN
jgi:tripartite-type tricarboxylate transporter receptor subunit TctC